MLKALSARIDKVGACLYRSREVVIVASSALLMVCLSGYDFISMWVVELLSGFTTEAPCRGLPLICDPSVYMKSVGAHAAWNIRMGVMPCRVGVCGGGGYGVVYLVLLLRCWASFWFRLIGMEVSVVP